MRRPARPTSCLKPLSRNEADATRPTGRQGLHAEQFHAPTTVPDIVRFPNGGFGWFEGALPPVDAFQKKLADLDEIERALVTAYERGDRRRCLGLYAALDHRLNWAVRFAVAPGTNLTDSQREIALEMLRRKAARWEVRLIEDD